MLCGLSIRDIVLVERLDLTFRGGLSVLTGETGAGKSILLDAMGLALGARADSGLVRPGADHASVTAEFTFSKTAPIREILREIGLSAALVDDGAILMRRMVAADGRSRAFVDDEPVSIGTLRRLGDALVEIQGQFDAHGLLHPSNHRQFLDDFAGHQDQLHRLAVIHQGWLDARMALDQAKQVREEAREQESFMRDAVTELETLSPEVDEEAKLLDQRAIFANAQQLTEALNQAREDIVGDAGADLLIGSAQRCLERIAERAGGRLDPAISALERASIELRDAEAILLALGEEIDADPRRLEEIDDRLHALRYVARKHGVKTADLPELQKVLAAQLDSLDVGTVKLKGLTVAVEEAGEVFTTEAKKLSESRTEAARRLDLAVAAELPELRLEKAQFVTKVEQVEEVDWNATGWDRVSFQVSTNPGAPLGALNRIASGGELSRFLLALRVALTAANPLPTLIFDEVDAGVGGAVADAVGERLQILGTRLQVLVVTHSPQVAARGDAHWRIAKSVVDKSAATTATELNAGERQEEIARMLSGEVITQEARAAAASLMRAAAET